MIFSYLLLLLLHSLPPRGLGRGGGDVRLDLGLDVGEVGHLPILAQELRPARRHAALGVRGG